MELVVNIVRSTIMAPYSSINNEGSANDKNAMPSQGNNVNLGFTASLLDTIAASKEKFETWVDFEIKQADSRAESFHKTLQQEQHSIDEKVKELMSMQQEMGLEYGTDNSNQPIVEKKDTTNCDVNDNAGHRTNIASRKKELEEKVDKAQKDVSKLEKEKENKQKRAQGKFITPKYVIE